MRPVVLVFQRQILGEWHVLYFSRKDWATEGCKELHILHIDWLHNFVPVLTIFKKRNECVYTVSMREMWNRSLKTLIKDFRNNNMEIQYRFLLFSKIQTLVITCWSVWLFLNYCGLSLVLFINFSWPLFRFQYEIFPLKS